MKTYSTVLVRASFIAAAAFVVNACSADDQFTQGGTHNTVIEATTTAPKAEDGVNSRTAIDPIEYTSGQIGVNWLPTDKIGVFGDKGSANVPFDNQSRSETASTTFAGTLKDGEKPLYAYYPYPADESSTPAALKGKLALTQHYSTASRELEGDWKVGTLREGSATQFAFEHIFSFLRFEINAGGTDIAGERLKSVSLRIAGVQLGGDFTYNMTAGTLAFTTATDADCVTMEWTDTPALTASTFYGYMNVAPAEGIAGKDIDITITTDRHIVTFTRQLSAGGFEPNTYYTVPLQLERFKDVWTITDNPDATEENAAWVPGLESRLACANTVFALPGKPFMHKIRVPQSTSQSAHAVVPVKTGVKRAYNLPEGLAWNADRCLVEGIAPAAGDYTYSVEFELDGQTYKEGIHLTVSDNLHQPVPHMGWQSWNVLETNINERSLKAIADALVANGWAEAGYTWLGIDDCWQQTDGSRDSNGVPVVNPTKFPNGLKELTDYIHSKGLKAGIYSDAGTHTCASGDQGSGELLGAYGYESQHAQAFTEWGFDKLKEDWFWTGGAGCPSGVDPSDFTTAYQLYGKMGAGIQAAGNRILLSMCEWGTHDPWKWGPEVGSSSWRMSYDHRDGWLGQKDNGGANSKNDNPTTNGQHDGIGVKNTIDLMRNLWSYVGINRFNDADMLVVGIRGGGSSSNDLVYGVSKSTITGNYYSGSSIFNKYTGMSDAEYETEFAMWCMYGSPLLLTLDVRKSDINAHDVALLKNEELIAINQDALGQGAEWVKTVDGMDYYMKDLADGDVAVAVVNLNDSETAYTVTLSDYEALDASASYSARDLIDRTGAGTLSASSDIKGSLAAHGTFIVRLKKQ